MAFPDIDQIQTVNERADKFLAGKRDKNMKTVLSSIDKLEKNILADIKKLKTNPNGRLERIKVNMKQAQSIHKSIVGHFAKEYNLPVSKMTAGFDDITNWVEKSYSYLGESHKFTKVDKSALQVLRQTDYAQFEAFGADAQEKISKAMYDQVIAGEPWSKLYSTVQGILSGHKDVKGRPMSQYARQYAHDSVMNFNNQVNLMKSEALGMKHFLYAGDVMGATRKFCRRRVGRIYTKEQIQQWDKQSWQGKSGPAMTHRGGYNCRHHWRGVRPEWFGFSENKGMPTDAFKVAAVTGQQRKWKVYEAWKSGERDIAKLSALADGEIKDVTLKTWMSRWKNGKNIPKNPMAGVPDFNPPPKPPKPPLQPPKPPVEPKPPVWTGVDSTLPMNVIPPTEKAPFFISAKMKELDEMKYYKAWSRRPSENYRSISISSKGIDGTPITVPGEKNCTGMAVRVFDNGDIIVDEITSSAKGYGQKMVQKLLDGMPPDAKLLVHNDWSEGWWEKMMAKHKRIVTEMPDGFGTAARQPIPIVKKPPITKPPEPKPPTPKPDNTILPPGVEPRNNREKIYLAWHQGERDIAKLKAVVGGDVKDTTLKTYLRDWEKGNRLPPIASKIRTAPAGVPPPSTGGPAPAPVPKPPAPSGTPKVPSGVVPTSNREKIYLAWYEGERDLIALSNIVDGDIKMSTLRTYVNNWSRGKRLPPIAKKLLDTSKTPVSVTTKVTPEVKVTPKAPPKPKVPATFSSLQEELKVLQRKASSAIGDGTDTYIKTIKKMDELELKFAKTASWGERQKLRESIINRMIKAYVSGNDRKVLLKNVLEGTRFMSFADLQTLKRSGLQIAWDLSEDVGAFFNEGHRVVQFSGKGFFRSPSTIAHEFGHAIDSRMASGALDDFSSSMGQWKNNNPFGASFAEGKQYQGWYEKVSTGKKGAAFSGGERYEYHMGNFLNKYEGRIYPDASKYPEFFSMATERYQKTIADAQLTVKKFLQNKPTRALMSEKKYYPISNLMEDYKKAKTTDYYRRAEVNKKILSARLATGKITGEEFFDQYLTKTWGHEFAQQRKAYPEYAEWMAKFYKTNRLKENGFELHDFYDKMLDKETREELEKIAELELLPSRSAELGR